jgi:hypothetical protein
VFQDYPESGSVQIGSTSWNWSISEVRSLPEGTVSYANLDFHDPENERNTMCVGLDEPFSPSTVDEIRELGRNPDERKLIAPDGSEWVLNPLRTPPERVRVSADRNGRMLGTITLPEGVRLGEMAHSDLLDLLELLP